MECPVCYFSFNTTTKIPKVLSKCGHTLCLPCINKLSNEGFLSCPFCKEIYFDYINLPNNFLIMNVLETTGKKEEDMDGMEPEKETALLSLLEGETMTGRKFTLEGISFCDGHPKKSVEFFCHEDNKYLCNRCILEHRDHKITLLEEFTEKTRKTLKQESSDLEDLLGDLEKIRNKYVVLQRDYQYHNKLIISKVEQTFQQLIKKLLEKKEKLISSFYETILPHEKYIKEKLQFLNKNYDVCNNLMLKSKSSRNQLERMSSKTLFSLGASEFSCRSKINEIKLSIEEKLSVAKCQSKKEAFEEEKAFDSIIKDILSRNFDFSNSPKISFDGKLLESFLEGFGKVSHFGKLEAISESDFILWGLKDDCKIEEEDFRNIKKQKIDKKITPKSQKNSCKKPQNAHSTETFELEKQPSSLSQGINEEILPILALSSSNEASMTAQQEVIPTPVESHLTTSEADLPEELRKKVIFIGNNNKIIYFDPNSNNWEHITISFLFENQQEKKTNIFKNYGACVYLGANNLFFTGGGPSNETFFLTFTSKNTAKVKFGPKMIYKRCWHGCVAVNSNIYVLGGFDGAKRLSSCERVDLSKPSPLAFEAIRPMFEERCLFGYCIVKKQQIYVMGGITSKNALNTDSVEFFDLNKESWSILEIRMPKRLCGSSLFYLPDNESILILGGSNNTKKLSSGIWNFDLRNAKFSKFSKMKNKRQTNNKIVSMADSSKLLLIGGNFEYNYEIFNIKSKSSESKKEFSYASLLKNDLNNYASFNTIL